MDKLENKKIAIIGVGNMGQAFADGLLKKRVIKNNQLILCNPSLEKLKKYKQLNIALASNKEGVKKADIVILAVKPQNVCSVLEDIKEVITKNHLIISIAAGIEIQTIKKIVGLNQTIIRVMPNLCAKIGESMSVWVKSNGVSKEQEDLLRIILHSVGEETKLQKEEHIDIATAISGSGPAYVFYLAELLDISAQELGLSKEIAQRLVKQTIIGSADILKISKNTPLELRQSVTSKGGTTEAAFKVFDHEGFKDILLKGTKAALRRAEELKKS